MKVETDAVLVVFWRWEAMVLRWHRPASRSTCKRRRQGRRHLVWCREISRLRSRLRSERDRL